MTLQKAENAAVDDRRVLEKDEIAGEQHAGRRIEHSQVIVGMGRPPGLQLELAAAEIERRRALDQQGRRDDAHVFDQRPERRSKRFQIIGLRAPPARASRFLWPTKIAPGVRKGRVAEQMIGMDMCRDDVADRLVVCFADRRAQLFARSPRCRRCR